MFSQALYCLASVRGFGDHWLSFHLQGICSSWCCTVVLLLMLLLHQTQEVILDKAEVIFWVDKPVGIIKDFVQSSKHDSKLYSCLEVTYLTIWLKESTLTECSFTVLPSAGSSSRSVSSCGHLHDNMFLLGISSCRQISDHINTEWDLVGSYLCLIMQRCRLTCPAGVSTVKSDSDPSSSNLYRQATPTSNEYQ